MITAGTFKASVVGAFLGESKEKKTPYFGIEFQLENGQSIDWIAYLTDSTKDRNLNTLLQLGFKGNRLSDLSDESKSVHDLFDAQSEEISVVIEMESYDSNGTMKERAIVKFVNVGEFKTVTKFDHAQAVKTLKSFSFDGDMARLRKEGYKRPEKKQVQTQAEQPNFSADDIPF